MCTCRENSENNMHEQGWLHEHRKATELCEIATADQK